MKSAYELAMERLEKKEPTKKLSEKQKAEIAEINSVYGAKIAERETFLQGELVKERAKGDATAVAEIQDQLSREVRRLHVEWEEKKVAVHGGPTDYEKEATRKGIEIVMAASSHDETLERLARTLDEYLAAVPRQQEPNPPDLLALFERLDAIETEMDSTYSAQLRHYLHQKSYRKAHLFLQDRDAENLRGNCGR